MQNIQNKVFVNLLWRLAERCSVQVIAFVISLVLARLLEPSEYGTVAIVSAIVTIMSVFVDSGLGNALIQKKDADDRDFSTVFITNIFFCIIIYGLLFIAAPFIASFYNDPALCALVRVSGITILIAGVKNIQHAYVSRNMLFKRFFWSTFLGTIISAVVGIYLAMHGYGAWALVFQGLTNNMIDTVVLWITVKWRPKRIFDTGRFIQLFTYGWRLLVSRLLDSIYNNMYQFIIGKVYTSSDLSFYNKGKQLPVLVIDNVNTSIDSVLFPAMSDVQDEKERVKMMTKRAIKSSVYVVAPLLVGMAVTAEQFIRLLITDKWLPCIPYLRIFCLTFIFWTIHTANLNAIKAMGRSDIFLKLEIYKKISDVLALLISMRYGALAMAVGFSVSSFISQVINAWPNKKLIGYGFFEQMKDILQTLLIAGIMGVSVYPIAFLGWSDIITLLVQVLVGATVYIGISALLKVNEFLYILDLVRNIIRKRK